MNLQLQEIELQNITGRCKVLNIKKIKLKLNMNSQLREIVAIVKKHIVQYIIVHAVQYKVTVLWCKLILWDIKPELWNKSWSWEIKSQLKASCNCHLYLHLSDIKSTVYIYIYLYTETETDFHVSIISHLKYKCHKFIYTIVIFEKIYLYRLYVTNH